MPECQFDICHEPGREEVFVVGWYNGIRDRVTVTVCPRHREVLGQVLRFGSTALNENEYVA